MTTSREFFYLRALERENQLTEAEHLAKLSGKQYALVEHLQEPSVLREVSKAAKEGPVPSKSAVFMLDLMTGAFNRLEEDQK